MSLCSAHFYINFILTFIILKRENINVFTPSNKEKLTEKLMFFKEEIPSKQIVNNVNGVARPGNLMAIMVILTFK